ncbi:hypothetical protein ACIPEN_22020 [Herbaspirillum chlorophenolicum]|uniref:Uncharacterized protein n=1 Tax=Herbaspirillum chlorophenolicum TaxID=211589 RepID=A0ABW8F5E0_9BURK
MKTLLLDQRLWDLCKDARGNIALASEPYAIAQDVASAVRLFQSELWYDTNKGIPYFQQIFGKRPALQFYKEQVIAAAQSVPGVVKARVLFAEFTGRKLTGQIQIIDSAGNTNNVNF